MKKLSLLFAATCLAACLFSQEINPKRSAVAYLEGFERTIYWDEWVHYFGLEYAYHAGNRVSFNLGFGLSTSNSLRPTVHNVQNSIRIGQPQFRALYAFFGNHGRYNLRVGFDARYIFGKAKYASSYKVEKEQPVEVVNEEYKFGVSTIGVALQSDFRVARNIFIGLQLDANLLRDSAKLKPLSIEYTENFGSFVSSGGLTSEPLPLVHGLVRVGLRF